MNVIKKDINDSRDYMVDELENDPKSLWDQAREQLKIILDDDSVKARIDSLTFDAFDGGVFRLSASTRFLKDLIDDNALDKIEKFLKAKDRSILKVDVGVSSSRSNNKNDEVDNNILGFESNVTNIADHIDEGSDKWEFNEDKYSHNNIDKNHTFENYVVGKPNQVAYEAAKRVCNVDDGVLPFNPLFLYGGVGLGKTHLMHAIVWEIKKRYPKKKVLYISSEAFMYEFINSLRHKNNLDFKKKLRSVDVLMVDDVQFIIGKDSTQEEFFHTFNDLVNNGKQIIISADRSPSDLDGIADRLRSRLNWGMVADVHPTTFELRVGILQTKAKEFGVNLERDVVEFLANKITSNVRELEGALTRLINYSLSINKEIDVDLCYEALGSLIKANEKIVNVDEILNATAKYFDIRVSDICSAKRSKMIAVPRQVAMFLTKQLTPMSLPEIGKHFGGRDHTTVMHSVKKITDLIERDKDLAYKVNIIKKMLLS